MAAEERRLALEEERLAKEKKAEERVIMFMDPNKMYAKAKRYWYFTREEIIAQNEVSHDGFWKSLRMDFGGLPCTNFMNNSLCHPILLAAIL
jgi:hypothetical protein